MTSCIRAPSVTSPRTISTPGVARRGWLLSGRRASARTCAPSRASLVASAPPRNPVAPVTRTAFPTSVMRSAPTSERTSWWPSSAGALRRPHAHDLRHAVDAPEHVADRPRQQPQLGVDDQLGLDQSHVPAAGAHLAPAGGEGVLDPIDVGPVGQREQVLVAAPEDVDRGAVGAARLAA